MKKALRYLLYIILIIGFFALDEYIYYKAFNSAGLSLYCYIAMPITTLGNIAIGVLIGLEHFYKEAKIAGPWKFDWLKALILLAPLSFLIVCFSSLIYGRIIFRPIFYLDQRHLLNYGVDILSVIRLLFGYWFITSFYKNNAEASQISTENDR